MWDELVYGGVAVVALVSAMIAGIMAIVGTRLWPIPAFVAAALTSLMIFYARHSRPVRARPRNTWRVIGTATTALTVTAAVALGGVVSSYAILGLPLEDDDMALTCTERKSLPRTAPCPTMSARPASSSAARPVSGIGRSSTC